MVYEPTGFNLELTQLNVPMNLAQGTEVNIEGVVSNIGAELIESFDVVWSLEEAWRIQLLLKILI